jgi:hypothetical protein
LLVGGAPQPMSKTSRLNFITCSRSIRPIRQMVGCSPA